MPFNLNEAPDYASTTGRRIADEEKEALKNALRQIAHRLLPEEIFPNGRIGTEKNGYRSIRVADITGRPPKERGSCRVWLTKPPDAQIGDWTDYQDKTRLNGDILSLIQKHYGLNFPQAIEKGYEFVHKYNGDRYLQSGPKLNGQTPPNGHAKEEYPGLDSATFDFNNGRSIIETAGEGLVKHRGLGDLLWSDFGTVFDDLDIRFNNARRHGSVSWPALGHRLIMAQP